MEHLKQKTSYTPCYEDCLPYIINFLKTNQWKVNRMMTWDDAFQEAAEKYVVTMKRCEKNGIKFETKAHFMTFFRNSLKLHFVTLSNKDTHLKKTMLSCDMQSSDDEDETPFELGIEAENDYLFLEFQDRFEKEAPSEVKEVISLLLGTPTEMMDIYFSSFNKTFGKKSQKITNEFLCFVLGRNSGDCNLVQKVKTFLG